MPETHISTGELSYYGLSLLSYLTESHPDRCADTDFIARRAESAAKVYSEVIRHGHTHTEAEEAARTELFKGLHFSVYDTLVNILWNEFANEVPEDDARPFARLLLPLVQPAVGKYSITDDFAVTTHYDLLYTELVGTIQILLEDGIQ